MKQVRKDITTFREEAQRQLPVSFRPTAELLEKLDAFASERYISRSAAVCLILSQVLGGEKNGKG